MQQKQQQSSHTYTLTHTHRYIHFPGKDSVLCPQWRMKKHSARVAPLSSYSTQVLTCPISEGKLKEPERPKMPFILNCVYFVCMCVRMNRVIGRSRSDWLLTTLKHFYLNDFFFFLCDNVMFPIKRHMH